MTQQKETAEMVAHPAAVEASEHTDYTAPSQPTQEENNAGDDAVANAPAAAESATPLQPDLQMITNHLRFLFDGTKYRHGKIEICQLNHGKHFSVYDIASAARQAYNWSLQGQNVYTIGCVLVPDIEERLEKRSKEEGRKTTRARDEDFLATQNLFIDKDDKFDINELEQKYAIAPPNYSVRTASIPHERRHDWWSLDTWTDDPAKVSLALRGIVESLGGDPAAKNVARLMRVGGTINFPNAKKRAEGRVPEFIVSKMTKWMPPHNIDNLIEAYPDTKSAHLSADKPEKSFDIKSTRLFLNPDNAYTVDDVRGMLNFLPSDCSYKDWIDIGMAIQDAGFQFELWDSWSRRGSKYKENGEDNNTAKKWASFKPGGGISLGTLAYKAQQAGWMRLTPKEDIPPPKGEQPKPQPEPAATDPQVPSMAKMVIPGLVGDTVAEILNTATQPQPELAILNTFAALGAAFGRRYKTPMNTRTNLYAVGIARTGTGKDHSRKFIKNLMGKAGMRTFIGNDNIVSGAGILTSIFKQPSQIMHLDEYGMLLSSMTDKNGAGYMKVCSRVITELYSASGGVYLGGQYANPKSKPIKVISPNVCIYGTTTQEKYVEAMDRSVIASGEINRNIIIKPEIEFPKRVRGATGTPTPSPGLVQQWKNLLKCQADAVNSPLDASEPTLVSWGPGVEDKVWGYGVFQDKKVEGDVVTGALWARYAENIIKIAMILAICRDHVQPVIDVEDFDVAEVIVKKSVLFMEEIATRHMSDSDHERDCNRLMNEIRRAGDSMSKTDLCNKTKDLNQKRRNDALTSLMERDLIVMEEKDSTTGRGRKAIWITIKK